MPRPPRIYFPYAYYHVFNRGNNKQPIFMEHSDYIYFLKLWEQAIPTFEFQILAYCLMTNHFHFFIKVSDKAGPSDILYWVSLKYVKLINTKYKRIGHLFQGRFKSILVQKDSYLLELSRYIHLNPIRAGIVNSPDEYPWSSYKSYVNLAHDHLVTTSETLAYFNVTDKREAYRRFVQDGLLKNLSTEEWFQKNLRYQRFLSCESFAKRARWELYQLSTKKCEKGSWNLNRNLNRNLNTQGIE